ncbi:hypothetical protein N7E02_15285 [Aliirhizobium terrae]|uniref:hypothetical protein n=1 Tax=Terrirhizobium terrae TaxID=2926709 RepID=UPI002575176C|nr:hypothetical protein [Rhizobium sp. CC-CFT758]WJH41665.1 hypothetical protein N7E02_15285 [Rhizobium sp. CC-CFT758]
MTKAAASFAPVPSRLLPEQVLFSDLILNSAEPSAWGKVEVVCLVDERQLDGDRPVMAVKKRVCLSGPIQILAQARALAPDPALPQANAAA